MFSVTVTSKPVDPEACHSAFRAAMPDCGAITAFTGVVRARGGVDSLSLSHYPGFTEQEIERISKQAQERWTLSGLYIVHRIGDLQVKEPIVFVAAASDHRRESFEAADFVMDYLKSEAPFWKSEIRGGVKTWIEPRARDLTDKQRWSA